MIWGRIWGGLNIALACCAVAGGYPWWALFNAAVGGACLLAVAIEWTKAR